MNSSVFLSGHTGSANRGCEAIIKSTADLFHEKDFSVTLSTKDLAWDTKLGISEFDSIVEYRCANRKNLAYDFSALTGKILRNPTYTQSYFQKDVLHTAQRCDVLLAVGGDTYCYDDPTGFRYANTFASSHQLKSVLWGCSIGEKNLSGPIVKDLKQYSMICPRETLTYSLMQSLGIPPSKLLLMADPAFTLKPRKYPLPPQFLEGNTVGINISPICIKNQKLHEIVVHTIRYLLDRTSFSVALIPHVFSNKDNQDLFVLNSLYADFPNERDRSRLCLFDDLNLSCRDLKYIISKCRFLLTARTHASIAAYSSEVPTFVLGYSVKSKGIAKDIFGDDYENYVTDYANLQNDSDLIARFNLLLTNEAEIKHTLACKKIQFLERIGNAVQSVCAL